MSESHERIRTEVEVVHLEMTSPSLLEPAPRIEELHVDEALVPSPELNRFFYTAIGGPLHWTDRLGWSYRRWLEHLSREEVRTWIGRLGGNPVGYAEVERGEGGEVEIVYFGLLPAFTGRGLGGDLLTRVVERCWTWGGERVRLHTCSLDGPAALPNYRSRGFRVVDRVTETRELPPRPPGPWPGAWPEAGAVRASDPRE